MSAHRLAAASFAIALVSGACHRQSLPLAEDHSSHMEGTAGGALAGRANDALPASNAAAEARIAASPRRKEWVKIPFEPGSKDTIMAWVVYPAAARAKAPVVVVVH